MKQYRSRGRPSKRPNKEEFDWLYYNLKMSTKELAKRYKVKTDTIYNWACQFRKMDD